MSDLVEGCLTDRDDMTDPGHARIPVTVRRRCPTARAAPIAAHEVPLGVSPLPWRCGPHGIRGGHDGGTVSDNGTDRCSEERHRLSTLPEDLHGRLDVVKRGPAEAALLLEAVMSVGRGLDLPQVLRRIVEAAVVVADAEYGALGVVGEGTRLTQFLPVGTTEERHKAIGPCPKGTASSAS
jgi:hypothetical protein